MEHRVKQSTNKRLWRTTAVRRTSAAREHHLYGRYAYHKNQKAAISAGIQVRSTTKVSVEPRLLVAIKLCGVLEGYLNGISEDIQRRQLSIFDIRKILLRYCNNYATFPVAHVELAVFPRLEDPLTSPGRLR
jgi:hypothetical protein